MSTHAKGGSLLYLRPIDSLEARALPGTENAGRPFWSPDSKSIGFVANGKLKRVDVLGGVPLILCDVPNARGGTWNQDGVILYSDRTLGLNRIPASGGAPVAVIKVDAAKGETFYYYPQFLPGGKEFLFRVRNNDAAKTGIYWGSLDGRTPVQILPTEFNGLYDANSGLLLYVQGEGTLMARKLELNPPRLSGDPVMVAQGLSMSRTNGYAQFSISGKGTLFYGHGSLGVKRSFAWWDRTGKRFETIGQPFEGANPFFHLSADSSRVAYSAGTPSDIWVMPVSSGIAARVSFSGGIYPHWSPGWQADLLRKWHRYLSPGSRRLRWGGVAGQGASGQCSYQRRPGWQAPFVWVQRYFAATAGTRAKTRAILTDEVQRGFRRVLARWPMGCLQLGRIGQIRDLHSRLSGTSRQMVFTPSK